MKISLYSCTAPINEILKTPYLKNKKDIDNVVLKDDCSILAPRIKLKSFDGFILYNYVYLPDFQRYYYIVDTICLQGGMIELQLKVDPLFSFSKDLGNCIIQERRATSGQGSYIVDDKVIMNASPQVKVIQGFGDMGLRNHGDLNNISFMASIASSGLLYGGSPLYVATQKYQDEGTGIREILISKIGWLYSKEKRSYDGYADCSSLLQRSFAEYGYTISDTKNVYDRGTMSMFAWFRDRGCIIEAIKSEQSKYIENANRGDILFYSHDGTEEGIYHVSWYDDVGGDPLHPNVDTVIEASSSQGKVLRRTVSDSDYQMGSYHKPLKWIAYLPDWYPNGRT